MDEQLFLIAKADRSWKNISQYETERSQGRRNQRRGATVAGYGGSAAVTGATGSLIMPEVFGTPNRAGRDFGELRTMRSAVKERNKQAKDFHASWGDLDDPKVKSKLKELRRTGRKRVRAGSGRLVGRNVGTGLMLGGAGALAAGVGMSQHGQAKNRNAEHHIARLRRERALTG